LGGAPNSLEEQKHLREKERKRTRVGVEKKKATTGEAEMGPLEKK